MDKIIDINELDVTTKSLINKYYRKSLLIPFKVLQIIYPNFIKYYDIDTGFRVAIVKS